MIEPKLFTLLPEYICTPDGMTIDKFGNLILSCPNYAQETMTGCVVRIDKERNVSKWFDVPVHPETKLARNMGIEFDSEWNLYICDNQGWVKKDEYQFKGRILKVSFDDKGNVAKTTVIANNMEHPNGIRILGDNMYVTQSKLSKVKGPNGGLVSCVYRFRLDEHDIDITNTLDDQHIFATFTTYNPQCRYGADGIAFNSKGELFVGNFGDGEIYKLIIGKDGALMSNRLFAKDESQLISTDGMIFDKDDNLYIADFRMNAIAKVTPDGKVERIAQSPDCDGFDGGLDQPGEAIVWNGRLIVSCFDLSIGPGKVNTKHEMPATMAQLEI